MLPPVLGISFPHLSFKQMHWSPTVPRCLWTYITRLEYIFSVETFDLFVFFTQLFENWDCNNYDITEVTIALFKYVTIALFIYCLFV